MINITVKSTVVPVIIGGLEFSMNIDDKAMDGYEAKRLEIAKKFENVTGDLEQAKAIQKEGFDWLLGEGAYDKLYTAFPSTLVLADVFPQVMLEFGKHVKAVTGSSEDVQKRFEQIIKSKKAKK